MSLTQMQNYFPVGNECSWYQTVAASGTTVNIGNKSTGSVGDYIEGMIVVPASSAAGAVTLLDGSTAVLTIPTLAGTGTGTQVQVPYYLPLGMRATTRWVVTTGSAVSVVVVGSFK